MVEATLSPQAALRNCEMLLLAITFISGFALVSWFYARSILFPPVVFCLVWAGILLGLLLSGDAFYPLSPIALLVCVLSCAAFSGGAMATHPLAGLSRFRLWQMRCMREDKWTLRAIDILFALFAGLFPIYWMRLLRLGEGATGFELLLKIRLQMVAGDLGNAEGLGAFRYVLSALLVMTLIVTTETNRQRLSKWRLLLWVLLTMAYNIPTGSRLGSLIVFFGMLAILVFVKNKIPFVATFSTGVAILIVFALVAVFLGKGGSVTESPLENVASIAKSLRVYAIGGIVACDQLLQKEKPQPEQRPSLKFFRALGHSLGFASASPLELNPPIDTPSETNVYSVFYNYFRDFGWAGMSAIFAGLGMGFSFLYRTAVKGRPEAVTLLGLGCSYLVLTCAGDAFISGLSACIQSTILVMLIYNIVPLLRWCNVSFSASPRVDLG